MDGETKMMPDREFTRHVIAQRIADKRRAPNATAAKNLLKKGYSTLYKRVGRNVQITEFDSAGNVLNGGTLGILQCGKPITLRAYRCTEQGSHWLLDPDKMEVVGELLIQL
jgi:hypothetical protein